MTYTEVGVSLKSGFKKIVLTEELVLVLNQDSQKNVAYTRFPSTCTFKAKPYTSLDKCLGKHQYPS